MPGVRFPVTELFFGFTADPFPFFGITHPPPPGHAPVAQLAARRSHNPKVASSILVWGSHTIFCFWLNPVPRPTA